MKDFAAVAIALLAAMCYAVAFVAQHHVAAGVPEAKARGLGLYRELIRSKIWWAGAGGDTLGYLFQALALGFGTVMVVQPVLVTSLVFALPLAAKWNGRAITRPELAWAGVVVVALAAFTIEADASSSKLTLALGPWLWPGLTILALLAVLALAAWRCRGTQRALALGVATGVIYGLIAALTELVVNVLADHGVVATLEAWPTWVLVLTLLGGTALQQAAFHAGELAASLPATQVLEPAVGVLLGLWALRGTMAPGNAGWVIIALSGLAMAVGTVQLARSAATRT